jgi:acetyl-CoA acetyltransferase
VSVAIRHHACLNPDAVMKKQITIEEHEESRPIALPLRLLDYCLINDGAVCLILSTREQAKDCRKPPVLVSGFGSREAYTRSSFPNFDIDFWHAALREAGDQAYAMAGIGRADVDTLMCYDNFSPTVLFSLEGLGFCPKGESGHYVEGGTLKLGGALPTNTDGGGLSSCHPGMRGMFLIVEAVRQLRGEAGATQGADPRIAVAHGTGGMLSTGATLVLGTEAP